jgi:hypothetical protein
VAAAVLTALAVVAVWAAAVLPDEAQYLTPAALVRVPVELVALLALGVVLPRRVRGPVAVLCGLLLAVVVLVTVANIGFMLVFARDVDPVVDWAYLAPGVGVLRDTEGLLLAVVVAVGAALAALAVLVLLPLAARRLARVAAEHRRQATVVVVTLATVWTVARVADWQVADDGEVASARAVTRLWSDARQLRADVADRPSFAAAIADDPLAGQLDDDALAGLRGKDVLVIFVESYGKVALTDPLMAPVREVLDEGTRALERRSFAARSGWLESPTYGAGSWLAHATLQAGLWVDTQQRYDQLLAAPRRMTLTEAFGRAGWRTVFALPSVGREWPEGQRFYGFDELFDKTDTGYDGPKFGWSRVPDQFALDAFRRTELEPQDRPPVFAEIELSSSHHPWTPVPQMLPWDELDGGRAFRGQRAGQIDSDAMLANDALTRAGYGRSIAYSLEAVVSWLENWPDERHRDLVVVLLGDHQPHTYVTGGDPDRSVPISLIARDRDVLDRIDDWGWDDGLRPEPSSPVSRMDTFRDRFVAAFGAG